MSKTILILVNHENTILHFRKEIIQGLIDENYRVVASFPKGPKTNEIIDLGAEHFDTKINRRGINPFDDLKLIIAYRKLIKKYNPLVVLTFTIKPNIYGGIASRITKTKYITNITGLGTAVENKGLLRLITTKLYKFALKKSSMIFFQNEDNMRFMLKNKIRGEAYQIIPGSGVNINKFRYMEYPKSDTINFLFVGRVMKDKGIDYYLEAAKTIKMRYSNVLFHVLGDYEENYKSIIEEYQSKGFINYHGKVNDVKEYYKIAHAIVHPSFHEGMSNVLLEAAASGRPILASNIPGCKETFDEEVSGLAFIVKNQRSLNSTIEKFINLTNREKITMGENGREKIVNEFDRNKIVKIYLDIIEDMEDK